MKPITSHPIIIPSIRRVTNRRRVRHGNTCHLISWVCIWISDSLWAPAAIHCMVVWGCSCGWNLVWYMRRGSDKSGSHICIVGKTAGLGRRHGTAVIGTRALARRCWGGSAVGDIATSIGTAAGAGGGACQWFLFVELSLLKGFKAFMEVTQGELSLELVVLDAFYRCAECCLFLATNIVLRIVRYSIFVSCFVQPLMIWCEGENTK